MTDLCGDRSSTNARVADTPSQLTLVTPLRNTIYSTKLTGVKWRFLLATRVQNTESRWGFMMSHNTESRRGFMMSYNTESRRRFMMLRNSVSSGVYDAENNVGIVENKLLIVNNRTGVLAVIATGNLILPYHSHPIFI